jgi:hypothetical protein
MTIRTLISCLLCAAALPCAAADANAVLWVQPANLTVADWTWGPGGDKRAPKAPFEFLEEDLKGTNAKIKVRDANGEHWTVKFGGEDHGDVFAARFLYAMGYQAQASYFVRNGVIAGAHGLKRAKPFLRKNGEFRYGRFKLRESKKMAIVEDGDWSWTDNPFVGTPQLNGLKVLMMLMSNWDATDKRDGKGSNTPVFAVSTSEGKQLRYAFTDWGATLGKWGGFFSRDKWNAAGYSAQTASFVRVDGGALRWGYHGKHAADITSGIRIEDVQWLMQYLARVSDEQIRAGLEASGALPWETDIYARSIRERISQLQRVAGAFHSTL